MQIAFGCTRDTNTQHLYDETKVFPMDTHVKLHPTELKQLTQTQTHPLHDLNLLSMELNFCYLSYSAYLILCLVFSFVFIGYNDCFELCREVPNVESTCCVFLIKALSRKFILHL